MTRRRLLLHLLEQAGDRGITTAECLQAGVGSRYSARLMELREEGYVIESKRVRDGMWRYELVGVPGVERDRAAVVDHTAVSPGRPVSLSAGDTLFELDVPQVRRGYAEQEWDEDAA